MDLLLLESGKLDNTKSSSYVPLGDVDFSAFEDALEMTKNESNSNTTSNTNQSSNGMGDLKVLEAKKALYLKYAKEYMGESVVDYLNYTQRASDYTSRKGYWANLGLTDSYSGTATQNKTLLAKIKSADLIGQSITVKSTTDVKKPTTVYPSNTTTTTKLLTTDIQVTGTDAISKINYLISYYNQVMANKAKASAEEVKRVEKLFSQKLIQVLIQYFTENQALLVELENDYVTYMTKATASGDISKMTSYSNAIKSLKDNLNSFKAFLEKLKGSSQVGEPITIGILALVAGIITLLGAGVVAGIYLFSSSANNSKEVVEETEKQKKEAINARVDVKKHYDDLNKKQTGRSLILNRSNYR